MNTFRKLMMAFACVAALCTVGCVEESPAPIDIGPTYVAPSGTGATAIDGIEYEYVATAEREAQIVAGFSKLKVGQSREEVRATLGSPDTATPKYGKDFHAQFQGWRYMYKIKMRADGPKTNDVYVEVWFTPTAELEWAVPNYIAGLKEVNSPADP